MKGQRTCIVCGATYKYCPACDGSKDGETWRFIYDNESCRKVFNIVSDYVNGKMTIAEAKKGLTPLVDGKEFNSYFSDKVGEILAYKETKRRSSKRKAKSE